MNTPSFFRRVASGRMGAAITGLAASAIALLVFAGLAAPSAIWSPRLVDHPGFSPADEVVVQEAWPELGVAVGLGGRLSRLGRAALGGALADESAGRIGPVRLAGAAAVLLVFVLVRQLGGGQLAALSSALGLAFGGLFWSRTAGGQPAAYAACFALATLSGLLWWRRSGRWTAVLTAAASFAGTVAVQPVTLAALPVTVLFAWRTARRVRQRIGVTSALVAGALAGALSVWRAFDGNFSLARWLLPRGLPGVVERLSAAGGVVVSDFGVLGLGFLAAGIVGLFLERRRTAFGLFGGWSAAVAAGGLMWAAPDWRTSVLPALSPAWAIVGFGMHWMLRPVEGRPARSAVALVVLLPIMSFAGHYWVGARAAAARGIVAASLGQLDEALPVPPVVIAEGGAVDRAVSTRSAADADGRWGRVAQDPQRVEQLVERDVPVVAFAGARANLEELGFRFAPVDGAALSMTMDEIIETVPPGWVVAIAGGRGFVRSLEPGAGPTFASIGGSAALFGGRGIRYGIIGIKGSPGAAREAVGPAPVSLAVEAGDSFTPTFRAPAALRVTSSDEGGRVEYGGNQVAATHTGVAVAIVSPAGELAGAWAVEYEDRGLRLPVVPRTLGAARVAGREPCAEMTSDDWTDVSAIGRYGALGALLGPGERIELYVAATHPLNLRQVALGHRHVPDVRIEETRQPVDGRTLPVALSDLPFVYHVDVVAAGSGRSQLALRFGGFAEMTLARAWSAGDGPLRACSVMRGGVGLFAGARRRREAEELDLSNPALFPFGWGRLERAGGSRTRWTRATRADMLVPLSEAREFVLEIEARPVGTAPTTLALEVNDMPLAPVALEGRSAVYRWEVPAGVWRAGMNRVRVSTSRLVRPSDVVGNADDRLLGLGVTRVRLLQADASAETGGAGPM